MVQFFLNLFSGVFDLFNRLVSALPDAWSFYFTMIFIYMMFRFVLNPAVGGSVGSDEVKKKR